MPSRSIARALTIAGSDPSGGAGVQADLKVFAAFDVYGMAAVTAITAQNTVGVDAVEDVSSEIVRKQIDVVAQDIGVDAAKTGMLSNAVIVETVAECITRRRIEKLVVDPVMFSTSGVRLLSEDGCEALKRSLAPLAYLVTPNIPEAEALAGFKIHSESAMRRAADAILALGSKYVFIKGGHAEGTDAVDVLYGEGLETTFEAPRLDAGAVHGTGCALSAAITAGLARGAELAQAVESAKRFINGALRRRLELGHGSKLLDFGWLARGTPQNL